MLQYEGKRVRGPNGEEGIVQNGQIVPLPAAQPRPTLELVQPAPEKMPAPQRPIEAEMDQQQLTNARLEEESKKLALDKARAEAARAGTPSDPKLVDAERTAAFLATRLVGSAADIARATKANPDSAKPSVLGTVAGVFGSEARNWANDPERRRVEAAQMDLLDAALTLGTGAAYTKEQLEAYRESYFPRLTDDPATVSDKSQRLLRLIEAAKVKAGNAAPQIDQALAMLTSPDKGEVRPLADVENAIHSLADDGQNRLRVNVSDDASYETDHLPGETREQFDARWAKIQADKRAESGEEPVPTSTDRGANGAVENTDAFIRGVADVPTFGLADELAAVGDTLFKGGTLAENLRSEGATDDFDEQNNPRMRLAGQFAGGMATFPAWMGQAKGIGQIARRSGALGAGYGYGSGDGGPLSVDRGVNALMGGAAGATGGALVAKASPYVANVLAKAIPGGAKRSEANELAKAALDLGIDVLPADVGGPVTRMATAAGAQNIVSAGPIIRRAQAANASTAAARKTIAERAGTILPADEAGLAVRKGAELFTKATSTRGARLYDKANAEAAGVQITPSKAIEAIDQNIAELSESGELAAPLIGEMEKIKRSLEGGISVAGIRQARTLLGGLSRADALRGTDAARRFGQVLEAATQDVEQGLSAAGKGRAAAMFRTADRFWKARVEQIDEVLQPIMGKGKSGEDIFKAVEGMARGNRGGVHRLSRLMASLPDDEAANIRATIVNRMGRSQKDTGETDAFSAARFITQWDEELSAKGKNILFGSGELRQAMDKLATVARGQKAADRYRNFSNTGGGVGNLLTGAGIAGAATGVGTLPTLAGLGLTFATGRLMASPRYVSWLARAPKTAAGMDAHIKRLGSIANRDPALRGEIVQVQQRILEALGQPGRIAAEQDEGNVRPQPPNE